ncbi:MAG: hypothetical protein ACLTSL_07240 [Odoribacter splanchnicus]|jgi:hypothetical protein|uniref:hypothetical protein n=1 Tax=Odoribacter sp. N15.MGS-14 TaxID=1637502 RepID=UPI000623700A|nr:MULTISPECIES: hypothetical protein [Odoribacter]
MIGLIVKYLDKTYKIGELNEGVSLLANIVRGSFSLEAGGMSHPFVNIYLVLREGIEFEVEVSEFDEASEFLSETINPPIIDSDYEVRVESGSVWNWKLEQFRKIESILKKEGLLD